MTAWYPEKHWDRSVLYVAGADLDLVAKYNLSTLRGNASFKSRICEHPGRRTFVHRSGSPERRTPFIREKISSLRHPDRA